jgi:hypothetical protein
MLSRREVLALSAATALPTAFPELVWALADDADPTRVFTGDKKPTDVRLGKPRTLDDYAPFVVPKTKEAWETRRKQLREQMLVATGLWPLPEKTPLNAVVHGKIERDGLAVGKVGFNGYTIEKVYFASMPGHYVCGNLYRPVGQVDAGKEPRYPGVLFTDTGPAGGSTTTARPPRRRASRARASRTWTAPGTSCRHSPRRSPGSASSSSTTT